MSFQLGHIGLLMKKAGTVVVPAVIQKVPYQAKDGSAPNVQFTGIKAGSTLFIINSNYVNAGNSGNPVAHSVTGSVNGAFDLAKYYWDGNENVIEIWYKRNCAAGSETVAVRAIIPNSSNYFSGVGFEHTPVGAVDKTGSLNESPGNPVIANGQNSAANMLVIAAAVSESGNTDNGWSAPPGYPVELGKEIDSDQHTGYAAYLKYTTQLETSQAIIGTNAQTVFDAIIATFPT